MNQAQGSYEKQEGKGTSGFEALRVQTWSEHDKMNLSVIVLILLGAWPPSTRHGSRRQNLARKGALGCLECQFSWGSNRLSSEMTPEVRTQRANLATRLTSYTGSSGLVVMGSATGLQLGGEEKHPGFLFLLQNRGPQTSRHQHPEFLFGWWG